MADHDHAYKLLFSHPQMVRDLLDGFIREDWLAQLDYASLEKVNASYVSDNLRNRASDVVWRVRWGKSWVYVYLLLEFQSTVDRYMAVRILAYVALLYQDLIRARKLPAKDCLPPVLPVVLYNGARRWFAAHDLSKLLQEAPRPLEPYCPQIRYVLIDQARYRKEELASLRNLVAALFRLEHSRTSTEVDEVLGTLIEWLRSPEQASLCRAFSVWVGKVILGRLPGGPVTHIADLQEMRAMLADRIQEWGEAFKREGLRKGHEEGLAKGIEEGLAKGIEEGLAKGLEEGLAKGLAKGRRAGELQLLLRQLQKRFGELPRWVHERLEQADVPQLERWGERLLEAPALERVFEG